MKHYTLLALLVGSVGCGPGARLEAEPGSIKANGASTARITFRDDRADGTSVYFETDLGHFIDDGFEARSITRSLAGGRASVELHSSIYPGTATVTASTDYGSATVTVELVRMRPSGRNIAFECDTVNIGALGQPAPDVAARCRLWLRDRDGDPIDPRGLTSSDYGFMAEAGLVRPGLVDDGYGNVYFLYTAQGGDGQPRDVSPLANEPSRAGETGGTRNPRDGLVTIVAWVRGEEGFHDINSNGVFEPELGETFVDSGEPFVDVDDDGVFDPAAGDLYVDVDGNGRYDGPNGRWDEDAIIWTSFKVLWTGPPHESPTTSRVEMPAGRDIPAGSTREAVVHLLDRNMNPIAAMAEDTVTIYPSCYSCTYPSTYAFPLAVTRGFEVAPDGTVLGNLFEAPTYSLAITNVNSYTEVETFTIEVTASATPAPLRSDGSYVYAVTHPPITFEGRLLGVRE